MGTNRTKEAQTQQDFKFHWKQAALWSVRTFPSESIRHCGSLMMDWFSFPARMEVFNSSSLRPSRGRHPDNSGSVLKSATLTLAPRRTMSGPPSFSMMGAAGALQDSMDYVKTLSHALLAWGNLCCRSHRKHKVKEAPHTACTIQSCAERLSSKAAAFSEK